MQAKKALIVGAGIGGLAAAIALRKIGWDVVVFEKASEIKGIGAAIVLAANAMKALDSLGVGDQVRILGAPVRKAEIRTWDGALLVRLPVEDQARRYGSDSFVIHRADLQQILFHAVGCGTVRLRSTLIHFDQDKTGVCARFADGHEERGDVLIGVDGIHSTVRKKLFGDEPLRYSGFTAIRGIANFSDERYPAETGGGFEAWGHGTRFGFTHIGQGRIFWFAAINTAEGEEKSPSERKMEALSRLAGWYEPIEAVIAATGESAILRHDIYDRKPLKTWCSGRVALLGDAAHPMLPNLGQGAAQGMEDAIVLARCLAQDIVDENALKNYEHIRMKRANEIVRHSRLMGKMVQLENPVAVWIRNQIIRSIPAKVQSRRLDWVAGYEP